MEHIIEPDIKTGKCPTARQLEIMMLLNPFMDDRCKSYDEVAKELGVTIRAINERMRRLKERCPTIYANFRECRFKKRKHWHKNGCKFCGSDIPTGQNTCSRCWARRARKQNPRQYRDTRLFPRGDGATRSTIDWEKDVNKWERVGNHVY